MKMKKIIPIIFLLLAVVACRHYPKDVTESNDILDTNEITSFEDEESSLDKENIDSILKDWPFPGANGNFIPCRDGLKNCDTIVDGFPYNHI